MVNMNKPLADRMRPTCFDEVAGQNHLVGKNGILRKLIENNRIPNMIFYGPPGTGKTTVANIIAELSGMQLYKLNATTASVSDVKEVLSSVIIYSRITEHFSILMKFNPLIKSNCNLYLNLWKTVRLL